MDAPGPPPRTFEPAVVLERCLGDRALASRLLRRFAAQLDQDRGQLGRACEERRLEDVIRTAHRLKGTAATLGVDSIHRIAAWIESAARTADLAGAPERLRALDDEARSFAADVESVFPAEGPRRP